MYDEHCETRLCVIAFLPHIYDASKDERNVASSRWLDCG